MSDEHERLRHSWIANAGAWEEVVRGDLIESRRTVTNAAIVDTILERPQGTVLDLGCGEGWLSRVLANRGLRVLGVDASAPLIESAANLGGATFRVIDYDDIINDASILGDSFDSIVANFSLLDDRVGPLLRALHAVLARDGRLIVQTVHPMIARGDGPYVDGWRTETFRDMPGQWREPMPWYFRTVGSWVRLFVDNGYRILDLREPTSPERQQPASILFVCAKLNAS